MNDCDIIQPELSAYVDGELTPHRRELVEAHLASCPRCQEALAELKTLTAGVAALPKLPTPPRFLAEVRAKIARGDHPEVPTWQDHLFRPVWIKVPLELAAVVAITISMMRLEQRQPIETVASDQFAQAESSRNEPTPSADIAAKTEQPAAAESAPASAPPPAAAAPDSEVAPATAGGSMPSPEPQETFDIGDKPSGNVAAETASGGFPLTGSQANAVVAGGGSSAKLALEPKRRVAAVTHGSSSLGITPAPSAAEVAALARSAGIEPSKISGVVVVHSKDLNDVQGRAEQLAARCNGKVISVAASMESTDQIFFVEVPREYAVSFKLDLQETAVATLSTNTSVVDGIAVVATNAALLSATSTARVVGVLTGGVETNAVFGDTTRLTLASNPQAQAAATTVLEILVVAPPSPASTNATPIPAMPAH
jgi:anti-sigma factor RsiW